MLADAGVGLQGWVCRGAVQVGSEEFLCGGLADGLCVLHCDWGEGLWTLRCHFGEIGILRRVRWVVF